MEWVYLVRQGLERHDQDLRNYVTKKIVRMSGQHEQQTEDAWSLLKKTRMSVTGEENSFHFESLFFDLGHFGKELFNLRRSLSTSKWNNRKLGL
jgi:hypothetical protein